MICPIALFALHKPLISLAVLAPSQIVALKNLGLNIRRAKLATQQNTFYITEASTSEKVIKSARLEEIRMTVLNSLTSKFPVSAQRG